MVCLLPRLFETHFKLPSTTLCMPCSRIDLLWSCTLLRFIAIWGTPVLCLEAPNHRVVSTEQLEGFLSFLLPPLPSVRYCILCTSAALFVDRLMYSKNGRLSRNLVVAKTATIDPEQFQRSYSRLMNPPSFVNIFKSFHGSWEAISCGGYEFRVRLLLQFSIPLHLASVDTPMGNGR